MYHQDWLIRQIQIITKYVFSLLTGKELSSDIRLEQKQQTRGDANTLSYRLNELVRAGELCGAEDLLFAAAEERDPEALTAGLKFYNTLNELPDETLERCNFPRPEILSGLKELCECFGYDLSVLGE